MGKTKIKTILGCLILVTAVAIGAFLYIKGITDDNLWVVGLAGFLLVMGMLFLNRAVADMITPKPSMDTSNQPPQPHKSLLERNNEMVAEWKKTSDARDKLKLLEAAGNAAQS